MGTGAGEKIRMENREKSNIFAIYRDVTRYVIIETIVLK
jgi:hypothetical protein